MKSVRTVLFFIPFCVVFLHSLPIFANSEENQPNSNATTEEVVRIFAKDLRKGHIYFSIAGENLTALGNIVENQPSNEILGTGYGFSGRIGLGLNRYVVTNVDFGMNSYSSTDRCSSCSSNSFRVGLGLEYHMAQGIAFDPWLRFGFGYRNLSIQSDNFKEFNGTYHGMDWLHMGIGGHFYPMKPFGFGPFLDWAIGSYSLTPTVSNSNSTYSIVTLGLNVIVDAFP